MGLHSCYELQIEHIGASHWMALQQGHPTGDSLRGRGQNMYARECE
jgi:hypothetical protein